MRQEQRDRQDRLDQQAPRALKDRRAHQAQPELPVYRAIPDPPDLLARQGLPGHKVHQEQLRGLSARKVLKD